MRIRRFAFLPVCPQGQLTSITNEMMSEQRTVSGNESTECVLQLGKEVNRK